MNATQDQDRSGRPCGTGADFGILLIADEVLCGLGRSGTMYAVEQDGVEPA